jgi:hypothetical protein
MAGRPAFAARRFVGSRHRPFAVTLEEHAIAGPAASAPPGATARLPFAHASEAEMARILDFYAVRWEYEPHVFPILWNLQGDVIESFSPDFYLPDLDVYLEMTTLKQRLVRKKNRKLRRLRELYPNVRIKLFYARDFRALMLKYGKLALVESLSGSLGQVVPDRSADSPLVVEPGVQAAVVEMAPVSTSSAAARPTGSRRARRAEARPTT